MAYGQSILLAQRARRSAEWKARKATARWRVLPDFVIIGGQRCGTTSLHLALAGHPEVQASFRKEVHYFDLHHERGIDWYKANFPLESRMAGRITFEATPNYLASAEAPRLMGAVIPQAKIIVLLRNPIERSHSSWRLRRLEGLDDRPFEDAVEDELSGVTLHNEDTEEGRRRLDRAKQWAYVEKSRYDEHFQRWFNFFNRNQFLILQSEALFSNPDDTLNEVQEFLGIDTDSSIGLPRTNSTAPFPIEPPLRQYLSDYFGPHNERLSAITGTRFEWE